MRKFLSLTLALAMIITMISANIVFADDTKVFDFGTPIKVDDTTYTVPIVINPVGTAGYENYIDNIAIKIDAVNCTLSKGTMSSGAASNFGFDLNEVGNYVFKIVNTDGYMELTTNGYELFTIDVTKTDDNASLTFGNCLISETESQYQLEADSANTATIELWKSTPEKPATAEIDAATVTKGTTAVGNDGTEYTDVPTYIGKVTINNIGSKKVVLTPVATLNGVAHTLKSAPTITFDKNTALDGGKVAFKFALIGAPETGVELTASVSIVD